MTNTISPDEVRRTIAYLRSTGALVEQLCTLCANRCVPGEELCVTHMELEAEAALEQITSALHDLRRITDAAGHLIEPGLLARIERAATAQRLEVVR